MIYGLGIIFVVFRLVLTNYCSTKLPIPNSKSQWWDSVKDAGHGRAKGVRALQFCASTWHAVVR